MQHNLRLPEVAVPNIRFPSVLGLGARPQTWPVIPKIKQKEMPSDSCTQVLKCPWSSSCMMHNWSDWSNRSLISHVGPHCWTFMGNSRGTWEMRDLSLQSNHHTTRRWGAFQYLFARIRFIIINVSNSYNIALQDIYGPNSDDPSFFSPRYMNSCQH